METTVDVYYQSLYEVAAAMNSSRSAGEILQAIVDRVAESMQAKGCALLLLSKDKKVFHQIAVCGLSTQYLKKGPVLTDRSLASALDGKVVAVLHASEDERIQYPEAAKQEGIASILSVPMMLRDEIIGVIRVYTAEPRHFSTDDGYFVGAVANLGAIALENSRLYKTLKKDYETFRREYFATLGEDRAW
jgi:GAF domain-containing protein